MSSTTVHVEGISSSTPEKEVLMNIGSGKISSLSVKPTSNDTGASQSATVTFEKETAAKTALLLDHTQLGSSQVTVKSAASINELAGSGKVADSTDEHDVSQEDKPRSRIFAEYLAHGYVISDKIIERALALDKQHGVYSRFTGVLQNFDDKFKATERAKVADEKFAVTKNATNAWNSLSSYFDSALNTPTGQKLRNFYTEGNKQVLDVHNEARHLANLKTGKTEGEATSKPDTASQEKQAAGSQTSDATHSDLATSKEVLSEKPALG